MSSNGFHLLLCLMEHHREHKVDLEIWVQCNGNCSCIWHYTRLLNQFQYPTASTINIYNRVKAPPTLWNTLLQNFSLDRNTDRRLVVKHTSFEIGNFSTVEKLFDLVFLSIDHLSSEIVDAHIHYVKMGWRRILRTHIRADIGLIKLFDLCNFLVKMLC